MSTSLLYHCFGIRGYRFVRCLFTQGRAVIKIRQCRQDLRCAVCGCRRVKQRGIHSRVFRTLPIGLKPVLIEFPIHQSRVPAMRHGPARQSPVRRSAQNLHARI